VEVVDIVRGQNTNTAATSPHRRDEILLSIAIIADSSIDDLKEAATRAFTFLERHFEFFELVLATTVSFYSQHQRVLEEIINKRNVRYLILRDGTGEYRAAVVAAAESIGDVVLFLSTAESARIDLDAMFDAAERSGGSVVLKKPRKYGVISLLGGRILSAISGYDVDPQQLRSCVHHRAYLNQMLGQADSEVALRFMPRTARRPSEVTTLLFDVPSLAGTRFALSRRLGLASEILSNAPPHMLRLLAVACLLVMMSSIAYFLYAITLYLLGVELERGWLTTSVAISGSTAFISLSLGAISTALFQILNLLRDNDGTEILGEVNNSDLFGEFRRVNVETLNDE